MNKDNKDKICMWVAWKLPKRIVLWAAIRLIANATQGQYSSQIVPELTAMDALDRWDIDRAGGADAQGR